MLESITLADFEDLIGQTYALDDEIEAYKRDVLKPKQALLDELEAKILETLAKQEMSSYKSKWGTVIRSLRASVRTPKTAEDKELLFIKEEAVTHPANLTRVEPCSCGNREVRFCMVERFHYIECSDCVAFGPPGESRGEAVKLWNRKQVTKELEKHDTH